VTPGTCIHSKHPHEKFKWRCVRRKVGAGVVICGDEEGTCINLQHPYVEFKEIVVKVCGEKVGSVILVADNLLV